jgi:FeS assembly SUF system protein
MSDTQRTLRRDDPESWNEMEKGIVTILKTVFDPEIPVDIWELGLIYSIKTDTDGHVDVDMTLTSPMCPVAGTLPPEVQRKVSSVPGVMAANVDVVWEPPWTPAMMSEGARLELNIPS